jgi:hypothetical protein
MSNDLTTGGTRAARGPGKRRPIPTLALTGAIQPWTVRLGRSRPNWEVRGVFGGGRLIDQFGQRALADCSAATS